MLKQCLKKYGDTISRLFPHFNIFTTSLQINANILRSWVIQLLKYLRRNWPGNVRLTSNLKVFVFRNVNMKSFKFKRYTKVCILNPNSKKGSHNFLILKIIFQSPKWSLKYPWSVDINIHMCSIVYMSKWKKTNSNLSNLKRRLFKLLRQNGIQDFLCVHTMSDKEMQNIEEKKVTTLFVEYNIIQLCWRIIQHNLVKMSMGITSDLCLYYFLYTCQGLNHCNKTSTEIIMTLLLVIINTKTNKLTKTYRNH